MSETKSSIDGRTEIIKYMCSDMMSDNIFSVWTSANTNGKSHQVICKETKEKPKTYPLRAQKMLNAQQHWQAKTNLRIYVA